MLLWWRLSPLIGLAEWRVLALVLPVLGKHWSSLVQGQCALFRMTGSRGHPSNVRRRAPRVKMLDRDLPEIVKMGANYFCTSVPVIIPTVVSSSYSYS